MIFEQLFAIIYNIKLIKEHDYMYEYKVEVYKVKESENEMNQMAKQGWRVVAITHCPAASWSKDTIVVTFERNKK